MEETKLKGNTLFLVIIGVGTLLLAVAATTFSYYTATISKSNTANSISVQTASITMTYNNGSAVSVTNLMPGGSITSKSVTITNNHPSIAAKYSLNWINVSNVFTNKTHFTYTVTCSGEASLPGKASTELPSSAGNIIPTITISGGASHTCVLAMAYSNPASNQDEDQGKTFTANLDITPLSIN